MVMSDPWCMVADEDGAGRWRAFTTKYELRARKMALRRGDKGDAAKWLLLLCLSPFAFLLYYSLLLIMSGRRASSSATIGQVPVDPNDPMAVLKFFGMAVAGLMVMKVLYSAMFALWIAAFPLIYLYAVQQCPSDESFDAKKELKRVLRG